MLVYIDVTQWRLRKARQRIAKRAILRKETDKLSKLIEREIDGLKLGRGDYKAIFKGIMNYVDD